MIRAQIADPVLRSALASMASTGRLRWPVAAFVVLSVATRGFALGGENRWTPTGPPAAVVALATDPTASERVHATSVAGLWVSEDHAATWTLIGPTPETFTALAVDPRQPTRILGGEAHLYRSTDGGSTWTNVTPPTGNGRLSTSMLRFDPGVPDRVYAAGDVDGLFRSDDAGSVWVAIAAGIYRVMDLAIDPHDSARLFLGTDRGKVFRSLDAGASWTEVTQPGVGQLLLRVAFAGPSSAWLFAVPSCCGGLYRSLDGGQTWTPTHTPGAQGVPTALAVDPLDPAILYQTLQPPPSPPELPPPPPLPVLRSVNGGTSWLSLRSGLAPSTFLDRLVIDASGTFLHAVVETGTVSYQIVGGGVTAAVPTLSPALLATLAILLGAAGILALRRV